MYKLYTNGCSHTRGTELALDGQMHLTWPNLLADHLGYELVDESLCGASNDTIYNTTLEYILSNPIPPDKVVIQFTVLDRFDIGNRTVLPRSSLKRVTPYNNFFKDYFTDNDKELSHKLLNQMYSLQNIFYEHAIEDYTFLVWRPVDEEYITYRHLDKDRIMFDVNHRLSQKFDLCMKPDPERWNKPDGHYGADAHEEMFNWLITKSNWNAELKEKETFIENVY